jgi:hypothetical protein
VKNLSSYLAFGGAIACSAWLAVAYRTLTMIADMFDNSAKTVFERQWNTLLLFSGASVVGAAMLAYGLITLSQRRSETYRAAMPTNGLAAFLLLCTAALMLLGNFSLYRTFAELATGDIVRAERFIAGVQSARWPLTGSAVCMLLAVGAAWWGSRVSLGNSELATARNPVSGTGFFGIMGGAILVLCSVWCLSGVFGLRVVDSSEHVRPDVLAASVSTVLVSTIGGAVGIAVFGVAFLLRALTPDPKAK